MDITPNENPQSVPPVEPPSVPPTAAEAPVAASAPAPEPTFIPEAPSAPVVVAQRHSHGGVVAIALVAALLVGGVAGAAGGFLAARATSNGGTTGTGTRRVELVADKTDEVVAAAAAVAVPSVVNLAVSGEGSTNPDALPQDHPDVPVQGEGSGVAYKAGPDGGTYIITNNHVTEGATKITVTDYNGETYDGELVGGDAESDIAVVLVKADIPTIKLGDSDKVTVGQLAIAIGSPFGLQASVTSGVVSALHRPLTDIGGDNGEYPYIDSIQTDAAINPGNSGGALVNRSGELIGIPSVIYTDTGVSDGVGLAIPVDRATNAADQLIDKGKVDTPYLGILGQTVNAQLASEQKLPVEEGAYIVEVTANTEAEKAGLKVGDVIVALGDQKIRSMDELILAVRRHSVGDKVSIKLYRDGKETSVEMVVGVKPASSGSE
jgi:S1-C subfamily serine protease